MTDQWWSIHVRERDGVLRSMTGTGYCGECTWCQVMHLRDRCYAILGAAHCDGGIRLPKPAPAVETVAVAGGVV